MNLENVRDLLMEDKSVNHFNEEISRFHEERHEHLPKAFRAFRKRRQGNLRFSVETELFAIGHCIELRLSELLPKAAEAPAVVVQNDDVAVQDAEERGHLFWVAAFRSEAKLRLLRLVNENDLILLNFEQMQGELERTEELAERLHLEDDPRTAAEVMNDFAAGHGTEMLIEALDIDKAHRDSGIFEI